MQYSPLEIQKKWQSVWADGSYLKKREVTQGTFYCLDMFPYPSGSGLHVGHWRGYVLSDVYARQKWMQGYEVLHPMGWDAFGLPAENYAIANGMHPAKATAENISRFKEQLHNIGAIFDWSKELSTTDPAYYKWTQWIFIQMYKAGLAYESNEEINWCPSCKTGLANEEVVSGLCERCKACIEKRKIRQWVLKITEYAEKLLSGLDGLDWPEKVKTMQRNWIGKSVGCDVSFNGIDGTGKEFDLTVYTTRPETLYGVTYLACAHDSDLIDSIKNTLSNEQKKLLVEIEQQKKENVHYKDKTGFDTGLKIKHPLTGERLPLFVGSYVLSDYGTGVVMGVPAHDQRDYEFALEHHIPIIQVIQNPQGDQDGAYEGDGVIINSGQFDGLDALSSGRKAISKHLAAKGSGKEVVRYRLRDWIFSRQRYWGEPIPLVHCGVCGIVPVPEDQLPLVLPDVEKYEPTGTGESPLAAIDEWVNAECPSCGGAAKRETNTMPQWAGSCWYFLRYPNPHLKDKPFDIDDMKKWLPVDLYVGGIEHAVLHLLYARFYVKFLHSTGFLPFDEPFKRLFNQGMLNRYSEASGKIEKMSKSKGNVVSPDELVAQYGSDTLRLYIIFLGPPELDCEWQDAGIEGCSRFLKKLWTIMTEEKYAVSEKASEEAYKVVHIFLKKFFERLDAMAPNTAVAAAMEFVNEVMDKNIKLDKELKESVLAVLSTMIPYTAAELLDKECDMSVTECKWPIYDPSYTVSDTMTIAVQVNGKLRGTINVDVCASQSFIIDMAQQEVAKWLEGVEIKKKVYVQGKIVNFVV